MAAMEFVPKTEAAPTESKEAPASTEFEAESGVKLTRPVFQKVGELSPASVGFNLIVKVGKIKPIMNRLNLDGTSLRISEAIIGDGTACIILSLRNDQIAMVDEDNVLILRNAKIDMVNNGYMRVAIDRWGLIEKAQDDQMADDIKFENNLSEVEYELVKEPQGNDMGRGRGNRRGRGGGRRRGRGRGRGRW